MSEFTVNYLNNNIDCLLDKLNQPNKKLYERLSEHLSSIKENVNNKEEFERIISIIKKYVSKKLLEINEDDSKNVFLINIEKDMKDIKNSKVIQYVERLIVFIFIYNRYEVRTNDPYYPYIKIIK